MPHPDNELKSEKVQEVLDRPPQFLITWGNVLVIGLLLLLLLVVNTIKIPETITTPVKIKMDENRQYLIVPLEKEICSRLKCSQTLELNVEGFPVETFGNFETAIHRIDNVNDTCNIYIDHFQHYIITSFGRKIKINEAQLCVAKFEIGKRSLFQIILKKITL